MSRREYAPTPRYTERVEEKDEKETPAADTWAEKGAAAERTATRDEELAEVGEAVDHTLKDIDQMLEESRVVNTQLVAQEAQVRDEWQTPNPQLAGYVLTLVNAA